MKKISVIFIIVLVLLNAYLFKVINNLESRIDTTDDLVINNAINSYTSEITNAIKDVDKYIVSVKTIDKSGTGFIYSSNQEGTYIVTSAHVVKDEAYVAVEFNNYRTLSCEVAGIDEKTDIAILKAMPKFDVIPAKLSKLSVVNEGETVIAVGASNSSNFNSLKTSGIVSSKLYFERINNSTNGYIVTDASAKSGYSGGPLINIASEVVGMTVMESNNIGGTFAITVDEIKNVADQLIKFNEVKRIDLGIKFKPIREMETYQKSSLGLSADNFDGVYVYDVSNIGLALPLGIKQGDIILNINGISVNNFEEYLKAIYQEAEVLNIKALRDGVEHNFEILLEVQDD